MTANQSSSSAAMEHEERRMTKYSKKSEFFCPVSPYIAWSWGGLIFKECPVVASEQNFDECRTCPLRGLVLHGTGIKPKRDVSDKRKKSVGKYSDGVTPKKGHTFVG